MFDLLTREKVDGFKTRVKDFIDQKGTGKVAWKMLNANTKGVSSRISAVGHAEYDKPALDVFPYYLCLDRVTGPKTDDLKITAGKSENTEIYTSTWDTDGMYEHDCYYYGFSDKDTMMKVFDRFKEEGFEISIDKSLQAEMNMVLSDEETLKKSSSTAKDKLFEVVKKNDLELAEEMKDVDDDYLPSN